MKKSKFTGEQIAFALCRAKAGICRVTHRTASHKGISVLLSVASPSIAKGGPV